MQDQPAIEEDSNCPPSDTTAKEWPYHLWAKWARDISEEYDRGEIGWELAVHQLFGFADEAHGCETTVTIEDGLVTATRKLTVADRPWRTYGNLSREFELALYQSGYLVTVESWLGAIGVERIADGVMVGETMVFSYHGDGWGPASPAVPTMPRELWEHVSLVGKSPTEEEFTAAIAERLIQTGLAYMFDCPLGDAFVVLLDENVILRRAQQGGMHVYAPLDEYSGLRTPINLDCSAMDR